MLDQSIRTAILALHEQQHGVRTIARMLGVSRGAVRDVLRAQSAEVPKLAPVLAAEQLSSRQVGALCQAFSAGTDETRALILSSPLVVLRAQLAAQEPKEKTPAQRLLSDLGAIAGIAAGRGSSSIATYRRARSAPPARACCSR